MHRAKLKPFAYYSLELDLFAFPDGLFRRGCLGPRGYLLIHQWTSDHSLIDDAGCRQTDQRQKRWTSQGIGRLLTRRTDNIPLMTLEPDSSRSSKHTIVFKRFKEFSTNSNGSDILGSFKECA